MRLISQLIRGLLTLLLIAIFGMGGAGAALGDWSRGGYPVSEHSLSVQSLDLAFTARAPPTSGRKPTFAGAALVQAGSMYALDGVEASGVVYTNLRSSIATNRTVDVPGSQLDLSISEVDLLLVHNTPPGSSVTVVVNGRSTLVTKGADGSIADMTPISDLPTTSVVSTDAPNIKIEDPWWAKAIKQIEGIMDDLD